ncbi:MAG: nuclear transport factor 2 family protein [Planctomycetota bacterium]|nr:nuclear transport factor 2 family protein [Planctomycetota bacterium]
MMRIEAMVIRMIAAAMVAGALTAGVARGQEEGAAEAPVWPAETEWKSLKVMFGEDETEIRYAVQLPNGFDPAATYPVLIAIAPGLSQESMVKRGWVYWSEGAAERGWIVVSPVIVGEYPWHQNGWTFIEPLLKHLRSRYNVEGDMFHIAGVSMGGDGAYKIALELPGEFLSLTMLPGKPPSQRDRMRSSRLRGMQVTTYVGADDTEYLPAVQEAAATLQQQGASMEVVVLPGEGHVLASLEGGGKVFDRLQRARKGQRFLTEDQQAVSDALDAMHGAAAEADFETYFGLYTPGAVFFGTDMSERWTMDEFRAFAKPHFESAPAWVYRAVKRHVSVGPGALTAWFDETLENEKLGLCRGTGVLQKVGNSWRIAQYNLSKPIPNEDMEAVMFMIRPREATMQWTGE